MNIFPAIDIKDGAAVRLLQGQADQSTEYFKDPLEPAKRFREAGATWVHVVDLDGAFTGKSRNLAHVERIAATGLKVQMGGGVRSNADIARLLNAGVKRFVVGSKACESMEFVEQIAEQWPEQAAVGIDARDGMAAIHGWVDVTEISALKLARQVAKAGIGTVIYTDISTDGMLTGPNFDAQAEMLKTVAPEGTRVIASGGVSAPEDMVRFRELAAEHANLEGVIIGKAIYEGRVDVASLFG
ncbi:MAG: 1-(5-phosphoribosyl)-5-[(5-phosphoribosylamino)methylideneamino]imidazole-4-carboxamide isomerase [Opitutales bacterium]